MPAPKASLQVNGSNPKSTTVGFLEAMVNAISQALYDQIGAIATGLEPAGNWSAASGSFPSGSTKGSYYVVSTAGTVDGQAFAVGDWLIPLKNNASTASYAGQWFRADYSKVVPRNYKTVADLTASLEPSRGTGSIWEAQGFRYEEVTSGENLTTAGGVKLKVLPNTAGRFPLAAFGSGAAALQAAATAAQEVFIDVPAGMSFSFASPISIPAAGLRFKGSGTLTYTGAGSAFTQSAAVPAIVFEGITLRGSAKSNSLFTISADIDYLCFDGCDIADFDVITNKSGDAHNLKKIRIQNNAVHDCGSAFQIGVDTIGSAVVSGNTFTDISRNNGGVYGILFGNNNQASQGNRGDYVVYGNTFLDFYTGQSNAECHAIILYGTRATVTGNAIDDLDNAGSTGAEAIYTKCRFSTITGNTLRDAGYSSNGAIAVKGQTRAATDAPQGYGCTVTGNAIQFTRAGGRGIYLANESVACTGNQVEGDTEGGIHIVASGKAFTVTGNQIKNSEAQAPLLVWLDSDEVVIADNIISLWKGKAGSNCYAIKVEYETTGVKSLTVSGNHVSCAYSGNAVAIAVALWIDTEDDGGTHERIIINGNVFDTLGSNNGHGIRLMGLHTIKDMIVTSNIVRADDRKFRMDAATFEGAIEIANNSFNEPLILTSGGEPLLTHDHINCPIVWAQAGAMNITLPAAVVGARFSITKADASANAVGFDRNNGAGDSFRGAKVAASISQPGTLSVRCHQKGVWDIEAASAPVTFA